ncbi:MAG TPA: hypothetical protein VLA74_01050 [Nitrososphaeraceae archaeon]|nr:hypothetical protein [Nitrososphaeraceae archaeon]
MLTTGMIELPVERCIDILKVFYAKQNEELWSNKIVKELEKTTGSKDKPAILKTIRLLQDIEFIEIDRSITKYKQKEIMILTPLGNEIINFIDAFERCYNSYTKLRETIIEHNFEVGENSDAEIQYNIVKNKLRKKGWNPVEIESFESIMRSAFKLETYYRKNILTVILNRYSEIIDEYDVNEIANKIILKIIMSKIEKIFLLVGELQEVNDKYIFNPNYYFNAENEVEEKLPFVDISLLLLEDIRELYYDDFNLINESVANNIDEVTLSLFLFAQPPTEDIQSEVTEMDEITENQTQDSILSKLKKENNNLIDKSHLIDDLGVVKLMDIYKKYLKLKQV